MSTKFFQALRFPLAALLAFALVRCGADKTPATAQPAEDAIPVKLAPVEKSSDSRMLQYSGMIASNSEARLSFKIGGMISKIYVKEGDHIFFGPVTGNTGPYRDRRADAAGHTECGEIGTRRKPHKKFVQGHRRLAGAGAEYTYPAECSKRKPPDRPL